jgi:hypothetical protein
MKKMCIVFCIVGGMFLLVFPALSSAQIMDKVNTPFQICCVGERDNADALAKRLVSIIPGLQTRVDRESRQDSLGNDVSYYALYVWHPEMTAQDICEELGNKECACCREKERDQCPGDAKDGNGTGD